MPVFFIHDPAVGTVTPLSNKPVLSEVEELSEISRSRPVQAHTEDQQSQGQNPQNKSSKAYLDVETNTGNKLGMVGDYMSTPIINCESSESLGTAMELMRQKAIHHLAITDNQGLLQGLLTESSILEFLEQHPSVSMKEIPLTHFCTSPVLSTKPHVTIEALAEGLLEQELSGIPVTENGLAIGMITRSDLLKVLLMNKHLIELA